MPIYDYACRCGARFEALLASWRCPAPACPDCGGPTDRRPPAPALSRGATPPPPMSRAPSSWEGVHHGDREYLTRWRRTLERRQEFEARHPEHAEHRDAVAAHEGLFERRPLTYRELAARAATSKDATQAAAQASRERRVTQQGRTRGQTNDA